MSVLPALIHSKFRFGKHRWTTIAKEPLFDPLDKDTMTAVRVNRHCACGATTWAIESKPKEAMAAA